MRESQGTRPAARWGGRTAPASQAAHLPVSQQKEGPCSPGSTEGPYKPRLAHRDPREPPSLPHAAFLCPGDRHRALPWCSPVLPAMPAQKQGG